MLSLETILGPGAQIEQVVIRIDDPPTVRGDYVLHELYCTDPACDCRRVLIQCVELRTRRIAATVSHAFDPPDEFDREIGQTFLDPINAQSERAPELLEVIREIVDEDATIERFERHYALVKAAVAAPDERLRGVLSRTREPQGRPAYPRGWRAESARRAERPGRNAPCWCGSGRKYKRCHLDADERTERARTSG